MIDAYAQVRFEAHRRFFVEEVPAWTEAELGVIPSREDRAIFGVSNGAAFAAAIGVRHPERFGTVIAFSLGITGAAPTWVSTPMSFPTPWSGCTAPGVEWPVRPSKRRLGTE